jgi:photosynthetic reaction center cytochrome c subunit
MTVREREAARIDAMLYFPLQIRDLYQEFHVRAGGEIAERLTILVTATQTGRPPLRLYFDQKNGLLLRLVRFSETPLGSIPTEVDYADYRETEGVKIPYRWKLTRPGGSFTIQIQKVQQNVPIDEKLFVAPSEGPAQ